MGMNNLPLGGSCVSETSALWEMGGGERGEGLEADLPKFSLAI